MKIICSWCGKIIKPEDGTGGLDTHGICPECADRVDEELAHNPGWVNGEDDPNAA